MPILHNLIEKLVYPDESEVVVKTEQTAQRIVEAPIVKGTTDTDEELSILIKSAISKGVMSIGKPDWYNFKGEKGRGEKGMIKKLRDNDIMLKILKKEVLGE